MESRIGSPILNKSVQLLRIVAAVDGGITFTELMERSRQPKATLHRLIKSLLAERLLGRDQRGQRYVLGPTLLELTGQIAAADVTPASSPEAIAALHELSRESGEVIHVSLLQNVDAVHIRRFDGRTAILLDPPVAYPACCTSSGKILLAQLSENDLLHCIEQMTLAPVAPRTLTSRGQLLADIRQAEKNGFAVEDEELEAGRRTIACAVFDGSNLPVCSVEMTVTSSSLDEPRTRRLIRMTMATADHISVLQGASVRKFSRAPFAPPSAELSPTAWMPEGDVPC
jgi:DNA-binding IclR family transcriptional regulator